MNQIYLEQLIIFIIIILILMNGYISFLFILF